MSRRPEVPIFFDRKGRRWKITRLVVLFLVMCVGILLYLCIPRALQDVAVASYGKFLPAVASGTPILVAQKIGSTNTPVIGLGPLVRVDSVERDGRGVWAVPLYGAGEKEHLSTVEASRIGTHDYVIERYGQTYGKRIALTFDDGPDPVYTPQVLDELSRAKVPATFFEIGRQVVQYPDITKRIVQEGHALGVHTFNHVDFSFYNSWRSDMEINQTERVIRAVSGYQTSFLRLPYAGNDNQSMRDYVRGILEGQSRGYVITSYQFDSDDWEFPRGAPERLPVLSGNSDLVVLVHDGGGDRSRTVTYVARLIAMAKAKGYTFVTLNRLYPQQPGLFASIQPSLGDKTSLLVASAYLVWPHQAVYKLFFITVAMVVISMAVSITLAAVHIKRTHYRRRKAGYYPLVSVIVPAYNEEKVLAKTVISLLRSRYRNLEIVIVDDGSKDATWKIARTLVTGERVRAFKKRNGGKARALNYGIRKAKGEIIIGIDADTVFMSETVGRLVRHFADPTVAAVAGAVKVGNIRNALTRWQMLDYTIGIYIERNAQACLGAIMIVPGACGAWRKQAIVAAGGFSNSTLAEDLDLTLAMHRAGHRVIQDNTALAYTEAPLNLRGLFKQRFRWIFGDIQAFWKYRSLLFHRRWRWLGIYTLPLAIFSILMPILFAPLLIMVAAENILAGNYIIILAFAGITMAMQFMLAAISIALARERWRLLGVVPLTRLIYGPVRSLILYRSVLRVLQGAQEGWNKLQRTGTVHYGQLAARHAMRTHES